MFSLSLSLFPLKSLSRFEEVLGVFISCAYLFCLCGKKKTFQSCCCFSVCCFKEGSRENASKCVEKRGKTNERKILNSLSSFLDTKEHCWLLRHVTRKNTEYYSPRRVVPKREREREMRKSSRGGVTTVLAKKKISSSFSQKRYHHRTPLGEINDDDEEDEQRVREKDSPMTVRRKWNKEHGVVVRRRKFSEQCSF